MQNKQKKIISLTVKLLIIAISWAYLIYIIYKDFKNLNFYLTFNIDILQTSFFVSVIFLMPINWALESLKWKYLISEIEKVSFFKSFKAVWTGVAVGHFTPNRIGEFGGRIYFLQKDNRIFGSLLTLYGDFAQFIVSFSSGILALFFFVSITDIQNRDYFDNNYFILSFSIALTALVIYIFGDYLLRLSGKVFSKKSFFIKFLNFPKIKFLNKILILLIGIIRYIVFVIQFFLILKFFNQNISFFNTFIALAGVFFLITIIPNYSVSEIGLRLSASIFFFKEFVPEIEIILFSSIMIYIINVGIPVIIGGFFLLKQK
ncbi:MAG: lysylphosphatidylglycerol synthase domain-containing protein [Bacteroidales bacterium]|jgi:uncharacterized membrane protein YbhN (UPF0104 family)|nr:lysylphosphatidylglycerol synthase domain-containing protein [Bacteroidales bacterium]HOL98398.1 lysylphosphatidylglycerol synthase domain-containing protein [Bacteroidales bacterium]HOM37405.1 lysylphosphatidylglycerol synthase domain-containing protein [Bacteroidales bacterium]HPD24830.1 lysylphosphatidylglycerol synthase domain-containing protein [Bacteroidales bacterium]HRS99568.1 lysylphosphatidylglycerol synthase domain-containing protein [Bacteroidales bacterium]